MKYKTSLRNHFKALEFLIIVSVGIFVFVLYDKKHNPYGHQGIESVMFVIWLVSAAPVLYLHIEYYCYNRGAELEIDAWGKRLIYTNRLGVSETYSFEDLSKIIIYMSPNMHRGSSFQILPFEQYHYARIYTKSGQEIIITCLLARKVQDAVGSIRGVPVEKKKRLPASILIR